MLNVRTISAIALLVLLAACSTPAASLSGAPALGANLQATSTSITAPPATQPGSISVTSEAEVRVPPDQVILTLGVETSDLALGMAKSKNDAVVQKVIALAEIRKPAG